MGQRQCLIDGVTVLKTSRDEERELHLCIHVCSNPVIECYSECYERNARSFLLSTLQLQLQLEFTTD